MPSAPSLATDGVAKAAKVVSVQVFNCREVGSYWSVMEGMEWSAQDAAKKGVPAVVSMSLKWTSRSFDEAVAALHAAGVNVVAAAGNGAGNACYNSPASSPDAITVGSIDRYDGISFFSDRGPCVDLFAPGEEIRAAWSTSDQEIAEISGTSMAAPHVSGVVAQLRGFLPGLSAQRVREVIICLTTQGLVRGLPDDTPNRLLWTGEAIASSSVEQCAFPPQPPAFPPTRDLCSNACFFYAFDDMCDDGGPGAYFSLCNYGEGGTPMLHLYTNFPPSTDAPRALYETHERSSLSRPH